jgi:hypothetical protein
MRRWSARRTPTPRSGRPARRCRVARKAGAASPNPRSAGPAAPRRARPNGDESGLDFAMRYGLESLIQQLPPSRTRSSLLKSACVRPSASRPGRPSDARRRSGPRRPSCAGRTGPSRIARTPSSWYPVELGIGGVPRSARPPGSGADTASVSRVRLLSVPQKVGWTSTVPQHLAQRQVPGHGPIGEGVERVRDVRVAPLEHVEVRVTAARVQRERRPSVALGRVHRSGLEHLGPGHRHRGHRPPAVRFGFGVVWGGAAQPVAWTRPSRSMSTAIRLRAAEYSSSVSAPGRHP